MSRQQGWSDEQIAAVRSGSEGSTFAENEKLLLRYADQMTMTPVEVDGQIFEQLGKHFSDEQIIELTASIAYENFRARFDHALGIDSDNLYCPLPGPGRVAAK